MAFTTKTGKMRIAIFGANGQIGKTIFATLRKKFPGSEILACVRKKHFHFEGVAGNHLQRSFVFDPLNDNWNVLGKLDVIINCIGAINENKCTFEEAHILPVLKIIDNRKIARDPRIIQVSALGAAPDSNSRFLRTKSFADEMILQQENTFVLRPSIVCTPGTMLSKSILRMKKISRFTFGKIPVPEKFPHTKIQPVNSCDLAMIVCKVIKGEIIERKINIAGRDEISIAALLEMAKISVLPVSQKTADTIWSGAKYFFKKLISDEQYQLLKKDNVYSTEKTEKITGIKISGTISFWKNEFETKEKIQCERKQHPTIAA